MKKISTKLTAIIMSMILLIGIMPITALAATTVDSGNFGDELKWSLNSDGVLTISGNGAMDTYEEEYPEWFDYVDGITSIVIREGVTEIGDFTFYLHYNVTEVTLPSSLRYIGAYSFNYCENLTEVTIPEGVITIGEGAFSMCTSLKNVTIPESVETIMPVAFLECYSLEQITVDPDNEAYSTDSKGVLFNKDKTAILCTPADLTGSYDIPDTVAEISAYSFTNSMFLEAVSIPASAVMIEVGAFLGCVSLTEVTVDEDNPDFVADERGVLFNTEKTALYCAPAGITDSYNVPDGVIVIYPFAFTLCMNLTNVVIPDTVTDIGEGAFSVSALGSVTIPESVSVIGDGAFSGCENLYVIRFNGDAPAMGELTFEAVTADVYYPAGNTSWTDEVLQNYGGDLSWFEKQPPVIPEIKGDVNGNGEITNTDLVMIARYIVGMYDAGAEEAEIIAVFGDMDDDGSVTNTDLISVARIIVGL